MSRHRDDDRFDREADERPWQRRMDDEYRDDEDSRSAPLPPNYLTESILALVFCCWPFAIPAIVYASQVHGQWLRGDYREARRSSRLAKMYVWISAGLTLGALVLVLLFAVLLAAFAN